MPGAAAILLLLMIFSTACAPAVPQEEYDRQVEEFEALEEEYQEQISRRPLLLWKAGHGKNHREG